MAQRLIDFPCLPTMAYIPGEAFPLDISFVANEGETEYTPDDGYEARFNFPGDNNEMVVPAAQVTALVAPDRGVRVTVIVPAVGTAQWPFDVRRGTWRIVRGTGDAAFTIGGGELRPSRLSRNVG